MMKRILSIVLSIVMLVGLLPTTALASGDSPEAKWGTSAGNLTNEGTIDEAFAAANADGSTVGYIQLQKNATMITSPNTNNDMTLDLQDYVLSLSNNATITASQGTLNLRNGTIKRAKADSEYMVIAGADSILYIENVTLDGGAVWSGDEDSVLGRRTTNSGITAHNVLLYVRGTATLNEGTVLQNNQVSSAPTNGSGGAVTVFYGGSLTINDGVTIRNNENPVGSGGAIKAYRNSSIVMNGGDIYGNAARDHGGAIQIIGKSADQDLTTFTMNGGTIRNNRAGTGKNTAVGGAIAVSDYSKFVMTGGSITDNTTAGTKGGGVSFSDGNTAMELSNSAVIIRNTANGVANNLYIGDKSNNKVTVGAMVGEDSVGITMANPGTFSDGGASYASCFFSDDSTYTVAADGDDLKLAEPSSAETHSHDMSVECGSTDPVTFTAWDGTTDFPGGNVYLSADVTLKKTLEISSGTVNLCLNGKVLRIRENASIGAVIEVSESAELNLCDCQTTEHKFSPDESGLWVLNEESGTKSVYGGVITGGNTTVGSAICSDGTLRIYGGNIVGNHATARAVVHSTGAEFSMYGGSICGNTGDDGNDGVGLCLWNRTGKQQIRGGKIYENTAAADDSPGGVGVYVSQGNLTISGAVEIYDNKRGIENDNIYVAWNRSSQNEYSLIIDGKLTNTTPIGVWARYEDIIIKADGTNVTDLTDYIDNFTPDNTGRELQLSFDKKNIKLLSPHSHAICGAETCTADHNLDGTAENHQSVTWTAWDGTTAFTGGNVYLTKDVTLTETLTISGTVNLCLNGHTIISNGIADAVTVSEGATLNICDCQGDGSISATSDGTEITGIDNSGSVNVYGGTVKAIGSKISTKTTVGIENKGSGSVNVYGGTVETVSSGNVFNMKNNGIRNTGSGTVNICGGTVKATHTDYNGSGCGIENAGGGSVNISDGNIDGKLVGLYNISGTVTVSGGTVKGGNTGISANHDIIISGSPNITGGCDIALYMVGKIIIGGALGTLTDPISVDADSKGIFTSGWTDKMGDGAENYSSYFTAWNDSYTVQKENGELTLTKKTYTVTFDKNDGNGEMESQIISYGVPTALSQNNFTKTGYIFTGWNTQADGRGTSYADKATVTSIAEENGSITLYAMWSEKVTFDVANTQHIYQSDKGQSITLTPHSTSDVLTADNFDVKYYKVDENENKLASATAVTNAVETGKYLYVIDFITGEDYSGYAIEKEFTVSDTTLPDISAYDNIGYMYIKTGITGQQTPIYFDSSVVNAYMDTEVENKLNNSNASTVTYESKNTDVAEVDKNTGAVTIKGSGSAVIIATSTKDETTPVYASYTLNVTKEVITVTAKDNGITYGDVFADNGYSVSKDGVTLGGTASYTTDYKQGDGIGKYEIKVSGLTSDIYDIEYESGTLSVSAKELKIGDFDIAVSGKEYDGTTSAAVTAKVNENSLVGGDAVTVLVSGSFANASVGKQTVNYEITGLSGKDSNNYVLSGEMKGSDTADIAKAKVTVSVPASTTYVYDGEEKSVNVIAYANGIYFGKFNVTYTKDNNAAIPKEIGTYTVGVALTDSNYELDGEINSTLTIKSAQQDFFSIEGISDTVTYGDEITLTTAGAIEGGTVSYKITSGSDYADIDGNKITATGIGTVTVEATSTKANYNDKKATRTFVISPKTVTVTAQATDRAYNGTKDVDVTLSLGGVLAGDTVNVSNTSAAVATADVENNKTVFVNGISIDNANYQLAATSLQTTVNITKAKITEVSITADNKVYDGTVNAAYTVTGLKGVINADKEFVTVTGTAAFNSADVDKAEKVTLSNLVLSGAKSGNYELTAESVQANASITQATVNFEFGTLSYGYDGKAKTVPVTATVNGKAFDGYTVTYDGEANQTNVGKYDIVIVLDDTVNYKSDYTETKQLEILIADQSTMTITGLLGTIDYGKTFALTAVGGNSEIATAWESSDETIAKVDAAGVVTIVGTGKAVTITATKAANGNYNAQSASVTFTPTKKSASIKITNLNQVYDGEEKNVTVTTDATYTTVYTDETGKVVENPINAGTYYVDVTAQGSYEGTQSAVLTIRKAKLDTKDITITIPENITYGDAYEVTTNYTGTDGVITYTGTGIYTEQEDKPVNAGNYMAILTISNDNYDIATVEKEFKIAKKTLTAKADDKTRAYGENNPEFTVTLTGFVNGDDESDILIKPTASSVAHSSSDVKSYDIIPQGGYDENYDFTYEKGTLSVTVSKDGNFYISGGNSNPYVGNKFTLTAYYNNEKPKVEWESSDTTIATVDETTGAVEIVGTGDVTITAKMTDSRFDNTLTATFDLTASRLPETQTPIYFDNPIVEKYVDSEVFTIMPSNVAAGATVTYKSSNADVATVNETTGEVTINKVGTVVITAMATKFNCADVYATYTLVVNKIPVTITADNKEITYGEPYAGTATFSNDLTADDFDGKLGFTTRYAVGKDVDEYDVTPNGLTSDIYDIEFVPGTITVKEKVLTEDDFTVIANNKVYDGTRDVTISAVVKSDAVVGTDNLVVEISGLFEDENAATEAKSVNYDITGLSGRGFENYVLDGVTGLTTTANISPCEVTFFISEETVKGYDGNAHSVKISAMANGNVFGSENYTVYYQAEGEDKTAEPVNVGEYTVSVELADDSGNYVINTQPAAKLKIETDASTELTIMGSNKNVTVSDVFTLYAQYGNNRANVTWASSDESIATVTENGEVTILKSGDVTITATMADENYGGLSAELDLTAAKKRITLSASATELIKTYNGEAQNVTFTAGTLDLSDITINTTYVMTTDASQTEPKNVGTYAVSYVIDDERYEGDGNFTLVINKATVTVSADAISKEYGEEPEYKLIVSDNVAGIDADVIKTFAEFASDGAAKTANVGEYDITVTLTTESDENCNYVVNTEANGKLTVTPATLTVNVEDMSREYGAENPTELKYTITGFKNDETAEILTGSLAPVYAETIGTDVATYEDVITAAGTLENGNYTVQIAYADGEAADLTITKIPVTASKGTARSSYLTIKFDKALAGLTVANFVVKNGDEEITLAEVTASSDNKTYTLKGSFSTSVTYTVTPNLTGTESVATHEITSEALSIKPTSSGGGGGGGGSSAPTTYTVKFETNGGNEIEGVKVTRNKTAEEPTEPTKDGYTFDGWYTDKELTTAYDFDTKVTKGFTLYAKWVEIEKEPEDTNTHNCPSIEFTDLDVTAWYHLDTDYVIENGIFKGVTEKTFAPNDKLTRAMLVTVLYRVEGEPATNRSIPFADIDMGAYYANAVVWAQQNGIVKGVSETEFAPDDNITREQIAAIMHRYAQYKGYDVSVGENTNILSYDDFDSISEYAIPSMQYAVGSGLMKGKSASTLNPLDNATRAEIAAILHRFIEANK